MVILPDREKIVDALNIEIELSNWHELYGNGNTAGKITGIIKKNGNSRRSIQ
jgi:UDP-N-acetylglucosamine 2-epimerase